MATLVEVVARQAQNTFAKSLGDETFAECLTKLARSIGQIRAKDVNLSKSVVPDQQTIKRSRAPVTYIEVTENTQFSMGIFVLRHGARIPLHDHPGMHGVLKVIQGKVQIFSYSALPRINARVPRDISRKLKKPSDEMLLIPVEKHDVLDVNESDEPCILSPTKGNFHEIHAINGPAAFIDILAPPYDMKERDCHYYAPFETSSSESDVQTWLLKTNPPGDFWCDSAPYHGPSVEF